MKGKKTHLLQRFGKCGKIAVWIRSALYERTGMKLCWM